MISTFQINPETQCSFPVESRWRFLKDQTATPRAKYCM